MPIPESQLSTWSNQGAVQTSSNTYDSVKTALASLSRDKEVYLQGSYKNSTNIYGDSDVDIVVQLNQTFQKDISKLSEGAKSAYNNYYKPANYKWENFRQDVLNTLMSYYGQVSIAEGDKSIKIKPTSGRLPVDVVVCLHYRNYESFISPDIQSYKDGIVFYAKESGAEIVNYPKLHYANGCVKNEVSNTNSWYKPTVRVFKNMKSYMIDNGTLQKQTAPSYFIECMIYNAPNRLFGQSHQKTILNIINWLNESKLEDFICQNGIIPLFGTGITQWNTGDAGIFIQKLINLWNNW